MKIGFHCNQLSLRGTEVAMFDYAHYNEKLLGNESFVLAKNPEVYKYSDPQAVKKFTDRFKVVFYNEVSEIDSILEENNADMFYAQKAGAYDGVVSNKIKTAVHAVFQNYQPHGTVYAFISEWLDRIYGSKHGFVPYMVDLPNENGDLREMLNIPPNAIVFGRHGGYETFDIPFVHQHIVDLAKRRPDFYFLFMHTAPFSDASTPNIIYLPSTADLVEKTRFINTCDAMIHARYKGETFGLAVGEFSLRNKPIITYKDSPDMAHGMILGNHGFFYSNPFELKNIFDTIPRRLDATKDWNRYKDFSPEKVMQKFKQVFID